MRIKTDSQSPISRMLRTITLLLAVCMGAWTVCTQAGHIRYNVDISDDSNVPANGFGSGYMMFNDNGPVPGNIFPNIVDWYFNVGGFIFSPSNTQPDPFGPFEVDASYHFVNDFINLGDSGPCFSPGGCQEPGAPTILLAFTSSLLGGGGALRVVYPTGSGVYDLLDFSASVEYSDPIFINEVPLPSVLVLFAVALTSLALSRRSKAR